MLSCPSIDLEDAIDQVLRRSAFDLELRDLALTAPSVALAKFNPVLMEELDVRFVEDATQIPQSPLTRVILLPEMSWGELTLSDIELDEFVGAQTSCTNCTGTCCMCTTCCPCTGCCITGGSS